MMSLRDAKASHVKAVNAVIERRNYEAKALKDTARALRSVVNPLLDELGAATWGKLLVFRRYTVMGPAVAMNGIEWSIREGKWKGDPFELGGRAHEFFTLRLAFDADLQPSYYLVQGTDTLSSDDTSPEALEQLLVNAAEMGPGWRR